MPDRRQPQAPDHSRFTPWVQMHRQQRLAWLNAALVWHGYTVPETTFIESIRALTLQNAKLSNKQDATICGLLEREWIEGLNP